MPTPCILVKLPNRPQFIGTFDMATFNSWWLSDPVPEGVEDFYETIQIYGDNVLTASKNLDGSYSVWRSPNYGKNGWVEELNTNEIIYSICRVDWGIALVSTSGGWYYSDKSGHGLTKISTQAPGCKKVVVNTDDWAFGHDGRYLWRSSDFINWHVIADTRNMGYYVTHGAWETHGYGGPVHAHSFDVQGVRVLLGIGDRVYFSDNGGDSFVWPRWQYDWWIRDYARGRWIIPPGTDVIQIVASASNGIYPESQVFIVRGIWPGTSTVRHWVWGPWGVLGWGHQGEDSRYSNNQDPIQVFDAPFTGYENGLLKSQEILKANESTISRMVTSAQKTWNATLNQWLPSFGFSIDGGYNWTWIDLSKVKVYDGEPNQSPFSIGGPFVEDYFTKYQWHGWPCHNDGYWSTLEGKFVRAQSIDLDLLLKKAVTKTYPADIVTKIVKTQSFQMDQLSQKTFEASHDMDLVTKIVQDYPFIMDQVTKIVLDQGFDNNVITVLRRTAPYQLDILKQKTLRHEWLSRVAIKGTGAGSYRMDIHIVKSRFDEIYREVEVILPQEFAIIPKPLPGKVMDYRNKHDVEEEIP